MQPSQPIKHTKSSLNQELRMMANNYPNRMPQQHPQYKNNNRRPQGFPNHNTFTNPAMIPSNLRRNNQRNPLQQNSRSFQNRQPYNLNQVNGNNPRSMGGIWSPNQLGGSKSFAQGNFKKNNPSINHSNVVSVIGEPRNRRTLFVKARRYRSGRQDQ